MTNNMITDKVLILGSQGMLGGQLIKIFPGATGWDRTDIDVTDTNALKAAMQKFQPTAVINCVAFNDVDGSEKNSEIAFKLNAEFPKNLAVICKELNVPAVHFSSNYVFDGQLGEYKETDQPNPQSVYAKSKLAGEQEILNGWTEVYIVRTSVIFGPKGQSQLSKKSFVDLMLDLIEKKKEIMAVADEINSLTYSVDLAHAVKLLLEKNEPYGIYHITNSGQASWYEFAVEIFRILGKHIKVIPVPAQKYMRLAARPKKAVLMNTKLPHLRSWHEALAEYLKTNH